jgi:hypothetical protein
VIQRVVLLKLRMPERREAIVAAALAELARLPGVTAVRAGRPADAGSEVWDVLVELVFADLDQARAAVDGPAYRDFLARQVDPWVDVQKAWTFRLG